MMGAVAGGGRASHCCCSRASLVCRKRRIVWAEAQRGLLHRCFARWVEIPGEEKDLREAFELDQPAA